MRVYHFVDSVHGINNLALKRLKVSRINSLNDPFEFLGADLSDPRDRRAFNSFKNELNSSRGLICFSKAWSNPLLWGHYANNHRGLALGFDISEDVLFSVIYKKRRFKIQFDDATKSIVGGDSTVNKLLCTKFSDWKYENEIRYFTNLKNLKSEGEYHFLDFSPQIVLREVIVGLNCDLSLACIHDLVHEKSNSVKVKKAGLALRDFRIIENLNQT